LSKDTMLIQNYDFFSSHW